MTTPNHQAELLPCPCGNTKPKHGFMSVQDDDEDGYGFVECHLDGISVVVHAATEAEAIAAWNTRPASHEAELVEALEEISGLPGEINPSNYNHDDACELNRQFCYAINIAANTLAKVKAGAA